MSGAKASIPKDTCPYIGLRPFDDDELSNSLFFGRSVETQRLADNVLSSRLTLVYGASGVGKSSLLNAGLAYPFRKQAMKEREVRRHADCNLIVFKSWQTEPCRGLLTAINGLLESIGSETIAPTDRLSEGLTEAAGRLGGTLVIVLDQFEEYFQYRRTYPETRFTEQFAEAVRSDIPINFLASIREDALAWLDQFKGLIPNLFENYLRMENLTGDGALSAIDNPLNELSGKIDGPTSCEAGLASTVITQIRASQHQTDSISVGDHVPASYLQIVMTKLWSEELAANSKVIRRSTLERLKGAKTIYETYLESTLRDRLAPSRQEAAMRVFEFMVTPSGRKVFQTASELVSSTGLALGPVMEVLESLRRAAILATVPAPSGETGYEFAHDVLAFAARKWWENFDLTNRLADEKRAAEEQGKVLRKIRRFATWATVALVFALAAFAAAAWEFHVSRDAESQALTWARWASKYAKDLKASQVILQQEKDRAVKGERINMVLSLSEAALAGIRSDPNRSLLLAMHAVQLGKNLGPEIPAEAPVVLRSAIIGASARNVQGMDSLKTEEVTKGLVLWRPDNRQVALFTDAASAIIDAKSSRAVTPLKESDFDVAFWNSSGNLITSRSFGSTYGSIKAFSASADFALVLANNSESYGSGPSPYSPPPAAQMGGHLGICPVANPLGASGCRTVFFRQGLSIEEVVPAPGLGRAVAVTQRRPEYSTSSLPNLSVALLDLTHGTIYKSIQLNTNNNPYSSGNIAWSPGGQYVALLKEAGTARNLEVLDGNTFKSVYKFPGDVSYSSIAWMADGKTLLAATLSSEVLSWTPGSQRPTILFYPSENVVFVLGPSPDSQRILVLGYQDIPRIYSLETMFTSDVNALMRIAHTAAHGNLSQHDCLTLLRQRVCPSVP